MLVDLRKYDVQCTILYSMNTPSTKINNLRGKAGTFAHLANTAMSSPMDRRYRALLAICHHPPGVEHLCHQEALFIAALTFSALWRQLAALSAQ